jgi:large subunit ribosomal protein L9
MYRRERQNMKVVLRKDVEKLGDAGTVQSVADGYARNYLIPKGLAVVATTGELKVVAENARVKEMKTARQERQLQDLADKINGQRLAFTARSGEQGRLYGSITAGDIAERLTAAVGQEIDRRKVVLEDPIRHTGEHSVSVHLVGRLRPQVTVIVTGERDEEEAPPAPEVTAPAETTAEE